MQISKLSNYIGDSKYTEDDYYVKQADKDLVNIIRCLQGRVRFGDGVDGHSGENVSGQWQVIADTGTANTEFTVNHTLGSVPVGFLVTKISSAGLVYDSGTAWTATQIFLKNSAANSAVSLFLFK